MPVAQQVGLAAAIDYLEALGMDEVRAHEGRSPATPSIACSTRAPRCTARRTRVCAGER